MTEGKATITFWKLKIFVLDEALSILNAPRNPKKLSKQLSLPEERDNLEARSHFHPLGNFLAPPKLHKRNVGLFRKGIRYFYYVFLFKIVRRNVIRKETL